VLNNNDICELEQHSVKMMQDHFLRHSWKVSQPPVANRRTDSFYLKPVRYRRVMVKSKVPNPRAGFWDLSALSAPSSSLSTYSGLAAVGVVVGVVGILGTIGVALIPAYLPDQSVSVSSNNGMFTMMR
jgi:hypothetical protein